MTSLADSCAASLDRDGWCVLERVLDPAVLQKLEADLEAPFTRTPLCQGTFYGARTRRFGALLTRSPLAGRLVMHPLILETVERMLLPWCERIALNLTQAVEIHPGAGDEAIQDKVAYISPFGTEGTQSMLARCVVPNPNGDLRPGLFVTAQISTAETDAPVAVKLSAIQTLKEKTVVFVEEGDAFEARPVELGARDNKHAEVLRGLQPGDKYVSDNSFILKAEIGKEDAEHED